MRLAAHRTLLVCLLAALLLASASGGASNPANAIQKGAEAGAEAAAKEQATKSFSWMLKDIGGGANGSVCFMDYLRNVTRDELMADGTKLEKAATASILTYGCLLMGAGLVVCLFGSRFFKTALFAMGFAIGGLVTFYVSSLVISYIGPIKDACYTLAVATALGGCAIGLVMLSVVSWALFLMGSVVGGAVGYGAALVLQLKGVAYYGTLLIPGLLCGCLATKQQKKLTVLGTATGGALCAARGLQVVLAVYPDTAPAILSSNPAKLLTAIALAALGVFCQWRQLFKKDKVKKQKSGQEMDVVSIRGVSYVRADHFDL